MKEAAPGKAKGKMLDWGFFCRVWRQDASLVLERSNKMLGTAAVLFLYTANQKREVPVSATPVVAVVL